MSKPRRDADGKMSLYESQGQREGGWGGGRREGSVYSRSILHFAIPIPTTLQRCIVSIAANGVEAVFVAIYPPRRFDVAIGSRLIARRLRFVVNRPSNSRMRAYTCAYRDKRFCNSQTCN